MRERSLRWHEVRELEGPVRENRLYLTALCLDIVVQLPLGADESLLRHLQGVTTRASTVIQSPHARRAQHVVYKRAYAVPSTMLVFLIV